jgi:3-methylfumaryl-CoA hydratase
MIISDVEHKSDGSSLQNWVGRREVAEDTITVRLAHAFCATFDIDWNNISEGTPAPDGLHWCLAPAIFGSKDIGPDGHPHRGGFLPPVPLPRRMWAGGSLSFHDQLRVGDRVERSSTVKSITEKSGRTGPLCFVVLEHNYATRRGLAIAERHDIVYRDLEALTTEGSATPNLPESADINLHIDPSAVLLFRYSALTFNGHRIHYDRQYATEVEHYPGLIVHGPLQATLLLDIAAKLRPGFPLRAFSFRALKPLFDTEPFVAHGVKTEATSARLWVSSRASPLHMDAHAEW